jgi:sterol desaturase/sphingolipid hydroxylase (fatty acid hydroxylase superfamily)
MNTILIVAAAAVLLIVVERVLPAVALPHRRGWYLRMALLNLAQAAIAFLGAFSWDVWLAGMRPWRFDGHPVVGMLIGYLAITFIYYWWHRARHEIPLLWRYLHQVHHSAARIEVLTSFYKHPAEIVINGVLSSAILYLLVGLSPAVATMVVIVTGIAELIYHANLRTPYWVGFFFQRPESHRVHHERGWHSQNYSDLPVWDWLFGTLNNPRHTVVDCGFDEHDERALIARLLGRTP